MTKTDLAVTIFVGSVTIATGVFFVVKGLSHNFELSLGVGILSLCAAYYFICESAKKAWEESDDE